MKKTIFIYICLFVLLLTSCTVTPGQNPTPSIKKYTISFDSNGGTEVAEQIVEEGNLAVEPKDPIKENYDFICWEYNNERYDFNTPIKFNITLVAKWEELGTHIHNYNEELIEPTCTKLGYTIYSCECGESYIGNYVNSTEHDLILHEKIEPTCTEIGCDAYVECENCTYSTYKELPALDHDLTTHEGKTPTDIEIGWKEYVTCSRCDYTTYEELPMVEIERAELEVYEENGYRYINYGLYPQTHVNDAELIASLNNLTETNERGYYVFEGKEYAKVVSNPYIYGSYTDKHGYTQYYKYSSGKNIVKNTVEWFKVEPIKWRILSIENNNYHVLSEYILTAQKYYKDTYYRQIDGVDIAPNNYKCSDIRSFLNNEFINSAFTIEQQNTLITTEVDNSASTTFSSSNEFVCENTFDKIFLLSFQDMFNGDFGLILSNLGKAKVTDYAKAIGVDWDTSGNYLGNGCWWLRSPDYNIYYNVHSVSSIGLSHSDFVDDSRLGVRPATAIAVD